MWLMRRRTYKYMSFEILRVIRQSWPRCFYDRGGYANADTFDEIFSFIFYLCAVLLLGYLWVSVRFVFRWRLVVICGNNFMGFMRGAQKACFWAKTAKFMKIALFWPRNFEKNGGFLRFCGDFGGKKVACPPRPPDLCNYNAKLCINSIKNILGLRRIAHAWYNLPKKGICWWDFT